MLALQVGLYQKNFGVHLYELGSFELCQATTQYEVRYTVSSQV